MPRVKKEAEQKITTPEVLMPESVIKRGERKSSFAYFPWILIVLVILGAILFVLNQQKQTKNLEKELTDLKQNPEKITEAETRALLDRVSQLIELPAENPTIATVTDPASLKDQPFFENAQIGDNVLIYTAAKKAFLYRPSTNKIIEVAPINLQDTNNGSNNNKNSNSNKNANVKSSSNSNSSNSSSDSE